MNILKSILTLITFSLTFLCPQEALSSLAIASKNFSKEYREYYVRTIDGWKLSLYRYKPKGKNVCKGPVVLCHGFNFNSHMWDLDEKHSLARFLQRRGYDVWSVNLRGSGNSDKPSFSQLRSLAKLELEKIPQTFIRAFLDIDKLDWTIDDHIYKDLPAIIDFIKSKTGKKKLTWIGHSMGGLVMYAYLETRDSNDIKNFIAIATMVNVKHTPSPILSTIAYQRVVVYPLLLINTVLAYQFRNLTLGTIKLPWENLFYNKDNIDESTITRMFRLAIDDTSAGVIQQYGESIKDRDITSIDKKFNYTKNLYRVKIPILIIAGPKDKFGGVETARYAYEHISSEIKELRIFSKENGYSADYGHCDLILGKNSKDEVYKYIYSWLEKNQN